VKATSTADTTKSGTATVTVHDNQGTVPTVNTVTVAPAAADVAKGGTQTFTVTVTGTNTPATTVTWSVTGGVAGTGINRDTGVLTVAAGETAATLTVTATSTVDTAKSGTATVTVTGGGGNNNGTGGNGDAGKLTVNNLTGDLQNATVFDNATTAITTEAEFNAATAAQVAFDGYDADHKTPFDMRMSAVGGGEPVPFDKTGKYLVVVAKGTEVKFKADVQFTNGSATVDYNTMTLKPGGGDNTGGNGDNTGGNGDNTGGNGGAGILTVNNLTGDMQNATVFENAATAITTQAEWVTAADFGKMVAGDSADLDRKSPFDMGSYDWSNNTFVPFDKTGKYLVLAGGDDGSRFMADVQFTNGSATVDYNAMTPVTSLPGGDN
jgi:hypothetical protein